MSENIESKGGSRLENGLDGSGHEETKKNIEEATEIEKEFSLLKEELTEARERYAQIDFEEGKEVTWLRKVLGKKIGRPQSDTKQEAFLQYKAKLKEVTDFRLGEMRDETDEEKWNTKVKELMNLVGVEERLSFYEKKTALRANDREGKLGGQLLKKSGDFVNWYRRQNVWAKGAVGVALAASGLAAASLGATSLAAGVGYAAIGRRVLGGAVAGTGVTVALEARHQAKQQAEAQTKSKEMIRQLQGKELEEKMEFIRKKLDQEIGDFENKTKNDDKASWRRKFIGAGVGVFIGSGAMGELLSGTARVAENSEIYKTTVSFWKEKISSFFGGENSIENSHPEEKNMPKRRPRSPMIQEGMDRQHVLEERIREIAKKMGIDEGTRGGYKAELRGGVPVEINGQKVPSELLTTEQHKSIGIANKFSAMMSGSSEAANISSVENPVRGKVVLESGMSREDVQAIEGRFEEGESAKQSSPEEVYTDDWSTQEISPEKSNPVILAVRKGSSLEGTIREHFKEAGLDNQSAGKKAHQIALAYAKEHNLPNGPYNLIHPGAQIELSPDGKNIVDIKDEKGLGYLQKQVPIEGIEIDHRTDASQSLESGLPVDYGESYESFSGELEIWKKELEDIRQEAHLRSGLENDRDMHERIIHLESKLNDQASGAIEFSSLTLGEQAQWEILKEYRETYQKAYANIVRSLLEIKNNSDMNIFGQDAERYLTDNKNSKAAIIFENIRKVLGEDIVKANDLFPKKGERVIDWSGRLAKFILKNKLEKTN